MPELTLSSDQATRLAERIDLEGDWQAPDAGERLVGKLMSVRTSEDAYLEYAAATGVTPTTRPGIRARITVANEEPEPPGPDTEPSSDEWTAEDEAAYESWAAVSGIEPTSSREPRPPRTPDDWTAEDDRSYRAFAAGNGIEVGP